MTGRVLSISPNAIAVMLEDGRVVTARNAITARCPPNSRVVVLHTSAGWDIIGRPR